MNLNRVSMLLLTFMSLHASVVVAQDLKPKRLTPAAAVEEKEFETLFDGKTLTGWSGLEANWRVEDGTITGENFEQSPISNNTFLVYDKPIKNFELMADFKITGGNSGIQYRSKFFDKDKFIVGGYQADIATDKQFMGILYEERGRGIIVQRGEIIRISENGEKSRVGSTGDSNDLLSGVKFNDWNTYRIVAKGTLIKQFINDVLVAEIDDRDGEKNASEGLLALQLHAGPPMKIQFKNITLFRIK